MKAILLTYPDNAGIQGILNAILQATKDRYSSVTPLPEISVDMGGDSEQEQALRNQLIQMGIQFDTFSVPTGASIANGQTVAVRNSAGADSHNSTAVVAGSSLTGTNLAATVAMVDNADAVNIQNSAGAAAGAAGAAQVSAGVMGSVRLPATSAVTTNGGAVSVRNSAGADAHAGTAVVSAGVLTGANLAATVALVDNGDAVPATGTGATATAVVVNGVLTGVTLTA